MADFAQAPVRRALDAFLEPDAQVRLCHPFGEVTGPAALYDAFYAPLLAAWPDLERRDMIVMAGETPQGERWVGACGHYVGTFAAPWLDIPPTGHVAAMRYHEFYRIEASRAVEMQAIVDLPEMMMQAAAWPGVPSLGPSGFMPGPSSGDGLAHQSRDSVATAGSLALVTAMLEAMVRHPSQGGPEVMQLERFWHPRFLWHGPAGIGTARGIAGFRTVHQIPFLAAMPDRGQHGAGLQPVFFADGPYVAATGWPNMRQTLTGGGWLGLPPTGQMIDLRSLDFWHIANGLIRQNWVLIDLLDVYRQLGLDMLARMRELNTARRGFDPQTGAALP
ncbi:MAG: ester cyclase [Phyllobacteriaceae bacterium]|nr:ester cyclase [Phyllobacteriaceae bacterium]